MKNFLSTIFIISSVLFLAAGCNYQQPSSNNDIVKMTITYLPNGKELAYSMDKNYEEINKFISLYNAANRYKDDAGTTQLSVVRLYYKDGDIYSIWGGSESYQEVTVTKRNKSKIRYNIKSQALDDYFDKFRHKALSGK